MIKSIIFFITLATACLQAVSSQHELKSTDIRNSMEELFSYHLETREMTSTVVKRSFKNFIEQFDPEKTYFIRAEVSPFLEINSSQIEQIVDHYFVDEYPEFRALNSSIVQAIKRARALRQEFYTDFINKGTSLQETFPDELSAQYAPNTSMLRQKIRARLLYFFLLENPSESPEFWTEERKRGVCRLFERRLSRYEDRYLPSELSSEHYFALHVLKSMARSLDAHTAYFSPQEAYEMRSSLEKQFEGIGVVLKEGIDGVQITSLIKGGPAEKSGRVLVGDILTEINGYSLMQSDQLQISYQEVLELLQGNGKKEISLGLKRRGAERGTETSIKVDLKREKILLENERLTYTAEPFGEGLIGKITLPSFYESASAPGCEADLREALRALKKQGKLLGLVIDLRDNLGGFLNQAVKVAGLFMKSGIVVVSSYAQGEIQYLRNVDPFVYYEGPLLFLTSKMSASAAEIVPQALQDYGIAVVAGDNRTYGKGSIQYQTVTDPVAVAYFKVTVGLYHTPSGVSTQIKGVQADIEVPTDYAPYNIGEKYLEYALKNQQIAPVYADTLADLQGSTKLWFQKNYLPHLQKKESQWIQMLPTLKANSQHRIKQSPNFQLFLKEMGNPDLDIGMNDLQMQEAINIVKDMVSLQYEASNHLRH